MVGPAYKRSPTIFGSNISQLSLWNVAVKLFAIISGAFIVSMLYVLASQCLR